MNRKIVQLIAIIVIIAISGCGGSGGGGGGSNTGGTTNKGSTSFTETWEQASIGSYSPATNIPLISADAGDWIIGDTVSEFPECGQTPHSANIISHNSGKALQLISNNSSSSCADNVWVAYSEIPMLDANAGFGVTIGVNTMISFDETGSLDNPQTGSSRCIVKPCGDTVALMLTDNRGDVLAYIFQRAVDAQPDTSLSQYREIFLNPDAGSYNRDLYRDFRTIPDFVASGAKVVSIEFKVQEHGDAILDNLFIKEKDVKSSPNPVVVSESDLVGVWRRQDPGQTHKGKEYLINGTGWLGNFNSGPFARATQLTWSLSSVTLTDQRVDGTRVEKIVLFDGVNMTTQRIDNGKYLTWKKQ